MGRATIAKAGFAGGKLERAVTAVTSRRAGPPQTENMTTLSAEMTVGEIAARLPGSVRVFEKYRIDFCCGGAVPFAEACQARGIEAAAVLEEIEQAWAGRQAVKTAASAT